MQIIENSKVKEKLYIEKLENGLTIMIVPKKGIQKKYVIWGTNYGSMIVNLLYLVKKNQQKFQKESHIFWNIKCLSKKVE